MPDPFVIQPRGTSPLVDGAERGGRTPLQVDPVFGPLAEHCADDEVTDIFVNGASGLFIDRGLSLIHI